MNLEPDEKHCPNNPKVQMMGCSRQHCQTCGWNPKEAERRKEILRRRESKGILREAPLHV